MNVSCSQDLLRERYDLRPTAGWNNNEQSTNTVCYKLELVLNYKIAKQCNQFVTACHGSTITRSSSSSTAIAVATCVQSCIPRYVALDTGVQVEWRHFRNNKTGLTPPDKPPMRYGVIGFLSRHTFVNLVLVARKRSWPDAAATHKGDTISKGQAKRSAGSAMNHTDAH
jgi:hypothetical protein